jgi:rhomboid family GlyGly-CTERM serine protease
VTESSAAFYWRHWATPVAVAAIAILLQIGGEPVRLALQYERAALAAGELWRLGTGHLVHLGVGHLWPNVAALLLLTALAERYATPAEWNVAMLVSAAAIDLGLWTLDPAVRWYVGLSGVLHGLAAFAAVRLVQHRPGIGVTFALGLAIKLLYEQQVGPLPLTAESAGGSVIVAAHLYGAAGGVLLAGLIAAVRRSRRPSL